LGRSLLSIIFGGFFEKKNNSAGIIAVTLVGTLCYIIVVNMNKVTNFDPVINSVLNVVFVVIGYYFGAKQGVTSKENDED
jgi:Na+/pantothenate symporter